MKLEVSNRRKVGILTNIWKLNTTLLNNQWVKGEISKYIRQRGKFIAINHYIEKKESYQINKLNLYLKKLEKEEEKKLRDSRWKETTAIRADTGQQNNRIKQNEKLFF